METRQIRELAVTLPGEEAADLAPADSAPHDNTTVADRLITGDVWVRARFAGCVITRAWFDNADLASIEITETTLDRCVLRGCSLIGAHLTDVTLKNVIFENCRLDFATLTAVRAAGPAAFLGCALTETSFERCKLNIVVFDGCKLNAPTFAASDLRGTDFRGNDLSKTVGVTQSFRGAVISEAQMAGFIEAVTRELELSIRPWAA